MSIFFFFFLLSTQSEHRVFCVFQASSMHSTIWLRTNTNKNGPFFFLPFQLHHRRFIGISVCFIPFFRWRKFYQKRKESFFFQVGAERKRKIPSKTKINGRELVLSCQFPMNNLFLV